MNPSTAIPVWIWFVIVLQSLAVAGITLALVRYIDRKALERYLAEEEARAKKTKLPTIERIRIGPPRGACGVEGCPILKQHSHVADLARRLREEKRR